LYNVEAGEYFATITSNQGCIQVLSTVVEEIPIPTFDNIEISGLDSCQGLSGKKSFGAKPYLFSLDHGASWHKDSIPVHSPGEFFLSVATLDLACIWNELMPLTIPNAQDISIDEVFTKENTDCHNPNGVIEFLMSSKDFDFLEFSIDNGNTFSQDPYFDQLVGGTYNPLVRSKNNLCHWQNITEVVITDPEKVHAEVDVIQPIFCTGANSGILQADVPPGATIRWSTGDSSPFLSGLKSGTYFLTIVNEFDCLEEIEVVLEEGPPFEEWSLPSDTTICKGDTFWIEAPPIDLDYQWLGDQAFILEENRIGIFLDGQYTIQVVDNEWCAYADEIVVNQEAQDFSGVDFLIGQEGLVGEQITAIDITWPVSDYAEWVLLDSNIHIIDQIGNQLILEFLQEGVYQIGLESFIGNCSTFQNKTINIYNDASQLQNQENHLIQPGKVLDFSLFPNPNSGEFKAKIILNQKSDVSLFLLDHMGNRINTVTEQGKNSYILDFSIENQPPGIYALILITGNEERYILFNKI
jgi:hypothetical protein